MEIKVKVEIGVSPELSNIMSGILNMKEWKKTAEVAAECPPVNTAKEERVAKEETAAESAKPSEKTETPKEEKQPKAEEKSSYTEEDVRAAMHECRMRIEGPDYKENTTGENYVKHHKNLTQWFKNQSALLGSDKPSALPAEARRAFIDICRNTTVADDGSITV